MKLSSSKSTTIVLLTLLVAVLLFAIYYYVVLPKKDEATALESSVGSIKSEIATLQSEISQLEEEQSKPVSNLYALRQKLPENRDIDELILNMEEIEYVTGSRIIGIAFNNYDKAVADAMVEDSNNGTQSNATNDAESTSTDTQNNNSNNNTNSENNGNNDNNTSSENNGTNQQPVSAISNLQLPASLKMVTIGIDIESPNHKQLLEFIREIEKLDRVMHVDAIEYEVPGEEQEFEETPKEFVEAKIQVTTFYYTGKQ